MKRNWIECVLALTVACFLAGPLSAAAKDTGKKAYDTKCASCHGKDGKGSPVMTKTMKLDAAALDLVDEASLAKTDEELIKITADGMKKMPAYKGKLKPEEIKDVVAYIRSLKPADESAAPAKETTQEKPAPATGTAEKTAPEKGTTK